MHGIRKSSRKSSLVFFSCLRIVLCVTSQLGVLLVSLKTSSQYDVIQGSNGLVYRGIDLGSILSSAVFIQCIVL